VAVVPPATAHAALISLRMGLGAATWVAPKLTARAFDVDIARQRAVPFVARLYGARNFARVAGLRARDADERDRQLVFNVAVDVADAASAVLAGYYGSLSRKASVRAATVALTAAALGVAARE
jgi:hypothetical protein